MVDSVGSSGGKVSEVVLAPVTRVVTPAPVKPATADAPSAAAASSTAKALAARAPVDTDRIERIKAAVASGTFPISPATIADQLIALKYEWMSNDQA